jgi:5'-nucleotidase
MTAGVTATLAQGGDLQTAIRIGGAAGAVNVTRHGLGTGRASVIGKVMENVELVPVDEGGGQAGARAAGSDDAGRARRGGEAAMTRRRVMVTNDDGIHSPGLHALAAMAEEQGYDVTVAAPVGESSGSSAAVTGTEAEGRIIVERQALPGLPGITAYAVAATPGLIALIACRGAFGDPPELVLSGVNRGSNVGYAVIHSGTVGAALTAVTYGSRAMAVSLDIGPDDDAPLWTSAVAVAAKLVAAALDAPERVAINLNVPNLPLGEIRGLRQAAAGRLRRGANEPRTRRRICADGAER